MFLKLLALSLSSALFAGSAHAVNLIENPGFESDSDGDAPTAWTLLGSDRVKDFDLDITPHGGAVQMQLQNDDSRLLQSVTVSEAGSYELSMWVANRDNASHHMSAASGSDGARLELHAGPSASALITPDAEVTADYDSPRGEYVQWTRTYNLISPGTYTVLASNGIGTGAEQAMFDDFSFEQTGGPPGPEITSFTAPAAFITSGESATLSWQVTPPFNSITLNPGNTDVTTPETNSSGVGSFSVSPATSTFYTLTATDDAGTREASVTVFVDVDPTVPRINEFVAATNSDSLADEDGETSDWIELYAPLAVDLSTYYLTDDATVLNKWAFPDVSMAEDSYLVVFASDKDRAPVTGELHTNFKLSAGGEYLALTRDDGAGGQQIVAEFSPSFPEQEGGFSFGISEDGVTPGYMEPPTPGEANSDAFDGFVSDTEFSTNRGFFSVGFNLSITTDTPGATIRYTTDGSEPTATNGTIYTAPININGTTTMRAAAFRDGFRPTNVDTHTYFFLEDVRDQFANGAAPAGWPSSAINGQAFDYGMDPDITSEYTRQEMRDALAAIPSVSITTTQANLTDPGIGIYTNPNAHGRNWERPASMEIVHPDGTSLDLQIDCGLRIRGGASRNPSNPKHAFRLFFRSEYGAGKLEYPLFGREGVDEFDKVDLRTAQNYSWSKDGDSRNTFLREVLGRDLQGSFDHPYTRSRYYHLYLNGVYWGLFMTQERAEANLGESYLGGDDDNYDTLKSAGSSGSYNTEATDGTLAIGSDWHTLWTMTRQQNSAPTIGRFMEMQGLNADGSRNPALPIYLDVDNLIDYHLVIGYTGNFDAPLSDFVGASNNWYALRDRVRDEHGFQFFVHDGEHSLGAGGGRWNRSNDRMNTDNGSNRRGDYEKSNPSFFHLDISESTDEYNLRFADRAHRALFNDGILTEDSVLEHLEARRETVADVIIAEAARWGDADRDEPYGEQTWINAVNSVIGIIDDRTDVFLGHLRLAGLYPNLDAPAYSQQGGTVAPGSTVTILAPTAGTEVYYMIGDGDSDSSDWQDDLDPRLLGGAVNQAASVLAITGGNTGPSITDYIQEGDTWSYLDNGSNQGTAWRASNFNDSGWAVGASELGYGDGDEETVIASGPNGARIPTTYFRKTVTIPDPTVFGEFEIEITYDDAYAIYVNGSEVARHSGLSANAPFSEYSTNNVGDNDVDVLDISKSAFRAGSNTIAVEVHQNDDSSSDVSFNLRLTGLPANGNAVALQIPQTVDNPVWIKSRTYNSTTGEWSALNEAFFTTAPAATPANIVISEVHYHPLDPTPGELSVNPNFDQDDFEFVEVMNIGASTVDLGGAAFVLTPSGDHLEGIEYTFPQGTLINAGERLVIVANSAAFAARYPSVNIAGDFSNRLDNTGEWITLVDSLGAVIDSFRYNDVFPWPEAADGEGNSLVLNDPSSAPDPALPSSWIASIAIGGNPGSADGDGTPFTGDPTADLDSDGSIALIEYFAGTSDTDASSEALPEPGIELIGSDQYATITFRADPQATDAIGTPQISNDLTAWSSATTDIIFVRTGTAPDGTPTQTYRSTEPMEAGARKFFRLQVQLIN